LNNFYSYYLRILLPIQQTFEIRILKLTKYRELIELALLSSLSFLIPVFIGHPQVLVGIVVNALIVRSALTMKRWKNLPTILLPSLGALTRGILFGPFTIYLAYLIPFIWLGNFVLAYFVKLFSKVRLGAILIIVVSSALKASVIFLPTLLLIQTQTIPKMFLQSMGIVQFITALIGSSIAIGITRLELKAQSLKFKTET
jgi:hypothetical protein